jgi:hypothetical protein
MYLSLISQWLSGLEHVAYAFLCLALAAQGKEGFALKV